MWLECQESPSLMSSLIWNQTVLPCICYVALGRLRRPEIQNRKRHPHYWACDEYEMHDVSSPRLTVHPSFPRTVSADACAPVVIIDVIITSTLFFFLWMVNDMVGLFKAQGTPPGVVAT